MIRRATPADRSALDRLQSHLSEPSPDLLTAATAELSTSTGPESPPISATRPTDSDPELSAFDVFVAVDDESASVVGYLLAVRGDPTHVAEVVVAPDHRRQGYGRALLDSLLGVAAERHADEPSTDTEADDTTHRIRLAVSPDNDAALGLYRSVGFTVARRDPDYFDGEPALLLVRPVGDDESA